MNKPSEYAGYASHSGNGQSQREVSPDTNTHPTRKVGALYFLKCDATEWYNTINRFYAQLSNIEFCFSKYVSVLTNASMDISKFTDLNYTQSFWWLSYLQYLYVNCYTLSMCMVMLKWLQIKKVAGREVELPQVSQKILNIASERHQKGMMSPWVYQLLSQVTTVC